VNVDRQMADMVTARDVSLEGVKLLTVSYLVRGGGLHWFLVASNRIVLFLLHALLLGPLGLVPFQAGRMSCRLREFSEHNQQLFMFSQTGAAEQDGGGFPQAFYLHFRQMNLVLLARFPFTLVPAGYRLPAELKALAARRAYAFA
jgi:hypothetical protein